MLDRPLASLRFYILGQILLVHKVVQVVQQHIVQPVVFIFPSVGVAVGVLGFNPSVGAFPAVWGFAIWRAKAGAIPRSGVEDVLNFFALSYFE